MGNQFIHLHLHTEYSIIDGIVRISSVLQKAVALGMPALAITDQANLFGMVKFYKAALKMGVKPIIGSEIWLENDSDANKPSRLILLCQNQAGYKNITQLISKSYLENQIQDRAVVKREWLLEFHDGLVVLSAGLQGDIGCAIMSGKLDLAKETLKWYLKLFPNSFYIELQRTGRRLEDIYNQAALALAREYQIPVVATNDVRFLERDDFEAHEAKVCIHGGHILNDQRRPREFSQEQYLRSSQEMCELFADVPEAIQNTLEIAKRCNLVLTLGEVFLPKFPVPDANLSIDEYLTQLAREGLCERLRILYQEDSPDFLAIRKPYDERLDYELKIITQMGFAGYFLIVADFIQWSKRNGIPVGPGRGSGAGSLVAYALKITDLDPLKFDLLFERFLNPERVSMPDFDVDFCMDGRDRVIEYVAQKYGRQSVAQIITYGSMAAKAVVRDVGRVLGHGYSYVDQIAKLIPFELGITLDRALEQEELLQERYEKEEEIRYLIDLARKLEGLTRNAGKHAGGVVISPSLLTDFSPLYSEPGGESLVTQFDKEDVEAIGLVKFDFLGLRTLTIINWAIQAINKKRIENEESPLDIELIQTDDPKTFQLLKACKTTAVFQLESRGMKDLIKRLQPDCFEEVIALVALFRPGPLQSGMVDDFINRKHGKAKVVYPHQKLEPILRPTYGVILYQEQVMQIAQILAGYSLGQADLLRKAMGKKQSEVMAKQRETFIRGAVSNGVHAELAENIFNLMEKFAGYGFNKSHSAAYALIAYQTAWLKTHYTAEFMAAVLSSDMDNTDKVVNFIDECRALNLNIFPPHVNQSQYRFIVRDSSIIYGLGAIKGVGEAAIENISQVREGKGSFKDLFDFCRRVDLRKVNRRVLEALIKSGALDDLGPHRAAMIASLDQAVSAAEQSRRDHALGQNDLFGCVLDENNQYAPTFKKVKHWNQKLKLLAEEETLGLYFSGHPLEQYETELPYIVTNSMGTLKINSNQSVVLAGLVSSVRLMSTKRKDRIAFIGLTDRTGRIEVSIFSDVYAASRHLLQKGQIIVVEGEVSLDNFTEGYRLSAKSVYQFDQAREKYAKHLLIKVNASDMTAGFSQQLKTLLKPYCGGNCSICIAYQKDKAKALLPLGAEWSVKPTDDLLECLREHFPKSVVQVVY